MENVPEQEDPTTQESERLAAVLNAMPGCYLQVKLEKHWTIQLANQELLQLLGFSALSDLLTLTGGFLENLVTVQDLDDLDGQMRQLLREGDESAGVEGECRLRTAERTQIWMRFEAKRSLQHDEDSLLVSFYDISQQKQASQQLALSMEELKLNKAELEFILGQAPGGIHVCQLFDPVHVAFMSDSLCELTGYSRSELEERFNNKYSLVIHPNDRHLFTSAIAELAEYPHELSIGYRLVRKDGRVLSVTDSIKSIRDPEGRMWAYAVVSQQDAGADSWQRIARFIECIAYPVAGFTLVDGKATLDIFNDAFCSLVGKSRERVAALGKVDPLFSFDEAECAHIKQKADLNMSGQDFVQIDLRVPAWSKGVEYNAAGTVFFRQSGIIRVICVIDTDELRTMAEKEIYSVSHSGSTPPKVDIRTFGYFDVFVDGQPVVFHSGKAKELLAFLVDRRGAFASSSEIIAALWENEPANKVTRARCRKTVMRLLDELKNYGVENIVETASNGSRRIIPQLVTCDYYEYLADNPDYQTRFTGAYMSNYSWGETTLAGLWNK